MAKQQRGGHQALAAEVGIAIANRLHQRLDAIQQRFEEGSEKATFSAVVTFEGRADAILKATIKFGGHISEPATVFKVRIDDGQLSLFDEGAEPDSGSGQSGKKGGRKKSSTKKSARKASGKGNGRQKPDQAARQDRGDPPAGERRGSIQVDGAGLEGRRPGTSPPSRRAHGRSTHEIPVLAGDGPAKGDGWDDDDYQPNRGNAQLPNE